MEQMEQNEAIQIVDGEIPNICNTYTLMLSSLVLFTYEKKRKESVTFSFVLRGHFAVLIR